MLLLHILPRCLKEKVSTATKPSVRLVTADTKHAQSPLKKLADFLLSSPKKIVDSARRTLYISYKTLWGSGGSSHERLMVLTMQLQEKMEVLVDSCGHGRLTRIFETSQTYLLQRDRRYRRSCKPVKHDLLHYYYPCHERIQLLQSPPVETFLPMSLDADQIIVHKTAGGRVWSTRSASTLPTPSASRSPPSS